MPQAIRCVVAAVLLIAAGYALVYYLGSVYSLMILPVVVAVREIAIRLAGVLVRIGVRRVVFVIILASMPMLWRRHSKERARRLAQNAELYKRYMRLRWRAMPWRARVVVSFLLFVCLAIAALSSGLILFMLTFMPVSVTATIGGWLKGKMFPILARFAAARGINRMAPLIWVKIPAEIKRWCTPRYRKLFRWTVRRLVLRRRIAKQSQYAEARFIAQMRQYS